MERNVQHPRTTLQVDQLRLIHKLLLGLCRHRRPLETVPQANICWISAADRESAEPLPRCSQIRLGSLTIQQGVGDFRV